MLSGYGVATISRLLNSIGLSCKRALWKRRYSAKETCNFKEPTNRSHLISACLEAREESKGELERVRESENLREILEEESKGELERVRESENLREILEEERKGVLERESVCEYLGEIMPEELEEEGEEEEGRWKIISIRNGQEDSQEEAAEDETVYRLCSICAPCKR